MRSIAVMNQKGGVGKTTTAVNLSAALADSGQRVCLVDLDPQAHASLHLGVTVRDGQLSIYDILTCGRSFPEVRQQVGERLWLVPAHLDLAAAEVELAGEVGREVILRDKLAQDDAEFDYMLIDCPPSLGVLTINALTMVHEVFLPLQPHFLALHGLSKLLRTIEIVSQRLNPTLKLSGVLLCMYDANTRLANEVSQDVSSYFQGDKAPRGVASHAKAFNTRIRRNVRLAEAPSFGQSILQYAPSSNGAEDYRALAAEVLTSARAAALFGSRTYGKAA
jgi:chromosome partitioning protein